ncbi:endonuclease/exonuclease/phosphatase family protein [Salinibacterium hongtaonis]|uniref:Endonuclease/exonuclease/phosphatase family protein n=1 Tax=Homoserinimonas hongtaonis TaxID=2079791 RepID=A0A2U1SZX7_9MICO|nr:endonuclease/exonuclease/phosphatase family protein [Salinibacterium hongtaonis]AWB89715.1 endonuclease/exonuclease/phosphatase family protein [Salinibacterium hongtaonis]PWB97167.1 endonuclease/exonuclease/phosphatase family protein [Salinibacterium hongtaonis]
MIRRLLSAALILATFAVLAVAGWPQLFGLQRAEFVAQVVSLRGAAAVVVAAAAIALLLLGVFIASFRKLAASLAVLALAFVALTAIVLVSRGLETTATADGGPSEDAITVLAWNTLGPATDPQQVADLAISRGAKIVVLPETLEVDAVEAAMAMREAGSPMWVLTTAYDLISPARSTSLLISTDLGEYEFDADLKTTEVLPTVVARPVNGAGPTIIAVHAVAPIPGQMDNWRSDLALLSEMCSGDNIIMAGDFNATIDHFAGLGSWESTTHVDDRLASSARLGECVDAAASVGAGGVGTWPTALLPQLGAPIDHVMTTDEWRVSQFEVVTEADSIGSDHRPVVAHLEPRA